MVQWESSRRSDEHLFRDRIKRLPRADRTVKFLASSTRQEPSIDSKSILLKDIGGTAGGTPLAPGRSVQTDREASPKHKALVILQVR
jgi:hypothetical protein